MSLHTIKILMIVIETERLILRTLKEEDAQSYFKMQQDPKVIEFTKFTDEPFTIEQAHEAIVKANHRQNQYGYTEWAIDLKKTGEFMGFVDIFDVNWKAHFTPATAIAWCLGSQYWNNGYITEAAKASLDYGFNRCRLKEIVSFAVPMNKASIRVMEKIGMQHDRLGDFANPVLPLNHRLSTNVLYRITKIILFILFLK